MTDPIKFRIEGSLPSMKNGRQIVMNRSTGKPMSIKSKKAQMYARYFGLQLPAKYKRLNLAGDLRLTVHVVYGSKLSDLDGEFLCDLLQDEGVIENDRQFKEKHYFHCGTNRQTPYVEVEIEAMA